MKSTFFFLLFFSLSFHICAQSSSLQMVLTDLEISNPLVEVNKYTLYSFKIKNLGLDTLKSDDLGGCALQTFISSDSIWAESDIPVHTFLYTDLAPNAQQIFDEQINIPSWVGAGDYYILAVLPLGNCVTGNATDNLSIATPIKVVPFSGLPCTSTIANGALSCTFYDANGAFHFITKEGASTYTEHTIDTAAAAVIHTDFSLPVQYFTIIEGNKVVKKSNNGQVVYSKDIPNTLLADYFKLNAVAELDGGYIIGAFKNTPVYPVPNAPNTVQLDLTLIKTDANFNVQNTKIWNTTNDIPPSLTALDDTHFAFGYGIASGLVHAYLHVLDTSLTITWSVDAYENASYPVAPYAPSPNLFKNACGYFTYSIQYVFNHSPYASVSNTHYIHALFNGSGLETIKSYTSNSSVYQSGGTILTNSVAFAGKSPTQGILQAQSDSRTENNGLPSNEMTVLHYASGDTVFAKNMYSNRVYPFWEWVQLGQKYYLLNHSGNKIDLTPIECDNNLPFVVDAPEISINTPTAVVFPNPNHGQCWITGIENSAQVTVCNYMGVCIQSLQLTGTKQDLHALDMGNIPAGAYMVHVQEGQRQVVLKIIVTH